MPTKHFAKEFNDMYKQYDYIKARITMLHATVP